MDAPNASPWLTALPAIEYLTHGARTAKGRRKFSPRFLAAEVRKDRLRAAKVGGRGELLYRIEWLDDWLEARATPVSVNVRRRA
jgi:hypothetical protein